MSEPPLACRLNDGELDRQRQALLPGLVERAGECVPIDEGFKWRFTETQDLLPAVAEVVEAERGCCPFLRFVVACEPEQGPVTLEVSGPPGTQQFLRSLVSP